MKNNKNYISELQELRNRLEIIPLQQSNMLWDSWWTITQLAFLNDITVSALLKYKL